MGTRAERSAVVFVIDDDISVRAALDGLIRSAGIVVRLFASTLEFLSAELPDAPGCIVLDVKLPGPSGLDLQGHLAKAGIRLPIIFITGYGDVPMSVRAMKAGALEFLTKPFSDGDLLAAIRAGIERDRARRRNDATVGELRAGYALLSQREREVMAHVVSGRMNKQIAGSLGLSEITVKVHRGRVMQKMGAKSLAELVRMADRLLAATTESVPDDTCV
jgi:FixJ family two-component response regulator